jgi:hypothetical protein
MAASAYARRHEPGHCANGDASLDAAVQAKSRTRRNLWTRRSRHGAHRRATPRLPGGRAHGQLMRRPHAAHLVWMPTPGVHRTHVSSSPVTRPSGGAHTSSERRSSTRRTLVMTHPPNRCPCRHPVPDVLNDSDGDSISIAQHRVSGSVRFRFCPPPRRAHGRLRFQHPSPRRWTKTALHQLR